jgi:putative nucleotidyltransferase with HDIG domain
MPSIRELIRNIDQLPAMPSVITELIELTSNPDSNLDEVLTLVEKDQALTAKLLKLCNSSYYGLSKQVSSLRNAVVLLGFKAVYKMVIAVGTSVFFKKDCTGYGLTGMEMWRHSLGCAISAETVANSFAPDKAQPAYTAGLLHDIGKLVLTQHVENELDKILKLVESGKTFIEAEQEIIGMDHGLIGGKLARQWKFPDHLVESIKYHHEPNLAGSDKDLVAFTHIGATSSPTRSP